MSALEWRKSSRSSTEPQCVEVAWPQNGTAIRDSKNTGGPRISVGSEAWSAWISGVKRGDLQ